MNKIKRIIKFYTLTNKLKNVIRTGWLNWHVSAERVESVAEHIYGTQMLALAMYSEYNYDIDIAKVMYMLAIHELEETIIGDLTYKDITKEEKEKIGHAAVEKILSELLEGKNIKTLIYEFDKRETPEAKFAYHYDKLECDLQCKLYDEAGFVSPDNQKESDNHNKEVIEKLKAGKITWSNSWMNHDRQLFADDKNFTEVLEYAINQSILPINDLNN